jgi:hypothetical protein
MACSHDNACRKQGGADGTPALFQGVTNTPLFQLFLPPERENYWPFLKIKDFMKSTKMEVI